MKITATLWAFMLVSLTASAQESPEEMKSYCEKAAVVMQIPDAEKANYIDACIKNRTAEQAEDK